MKIAIVVGHFVPGVGYQEVYLARAFRRLGHEVCVFTSTKSFTYKNQEKNFKHESGSYYDRNYGYKIVRSKTFFSVGSIVLCKGLKKGIINYDPDIIIIIAVGQLFPLPLLISKSKGKFQLVSIFGDNSDYYNWSTFSNIFISLRVILTKQILKRWIYRIAIKKSDKIYLNTPETKSIIESYLQPTLRKELDNKFINSTLGFDPDIFYFDLEERKYCRDELKIKDDETVLITSTKVLKRKNLEKIIKVVSKLNEYGTKTHYIIVGFLGDNYEDKLKNFINIQPHPEMFKCFPFSDHNKIRKYYSAADIGIWLKATISIQEAMGTGLPIILEDKGSVNHLIEHNVTGWYYEKEKFEECISNAVEVLSKKSKLKKIEFRESIAFSNHDRFSYNHLASQML